MGQDATLNAAASANRLHISFFGCRNAGKSSVVNAVTGQDLAVVSEVKGTTTEETVLRTLLAPRFKSVQYSFHSATAVSLLKRIEVKHV